MLDLLREAWTRVGPQLSERAGAAAYDAWLAVLRPIALERGVFYLEADNRVVCERVERLYRELLEDTLSAEIGTRVSVHVVPAAESLLVDQIEVGPSRPIVDSGNRTAFLVLSSLLEGVELPGRLFVFWGPEGAGKSFLVRWWAQHHEVPPRTFTGPQLVKAFGACLRDGRLAALRAELREDRPLLLDELHRIAGHRRLQRELVAVLEERRLTEHPVVVVSRWHPSEIRDFDPSLASVLCSGFVTEIDEPGPEARLRFLRALEGAPSRNGRAEGIESLAREFRGGYRKLRHAWVLQRQVHRYPSRYLQLIDPRSAFERLRRRVAERLGVDADEMIGKSQSRRLSFARQVLSYLCLREGLNRAEIGRFLGGRSRAAISYAIKTLEKRIAADPDVRAEVEALL